MAIFGHIPAIVPGLLSILIFLFGIIALATGIPGCTYFQNPPQDALASITALSVLTGFFAIMTFIFAILGMLLRVAPSIMGLASFSMCALLAMFAWLNSGGIAILVAGGTTDVLGFRLLKASLAFSIITGVLAIAFLGLSVGVHISEKEDEGKETMSGGSK